MGKGSFFLEGRLHAGRSDWSGVKVVAFWLLFLHLWYVMPVSCAHFETPVSQGRTCLALCQLVSIPEPNQSPSRHVIPPPRSLLAHSRLRVEQRMLRFHALQYCIMHLNNNTFSRGKTCFTQSILFVRCLHMCEISVFTCVTYLHLINDDEAFTLL